jgi:hypothetical protein
MNFNDTKQIVGGEESQVIVGAVLYTVTDGLRGFALTVRTQGTIISAISVQDESGIARAYVPTWLGIALNQGDYFVSKFPIVNMTLTAAADSVVLHCNKPY